MSIFFSSSFHVKVVEHLNVPADLHCLQEEFLGVPKKRGRSIDEIELFEWNKCVFALWVQVLTGGPSGPGRPGSPGRPSGPYNTNPSHSSQHSSCSCAEAAINNILQTACHSTCKYTSNHIWFLIWIYVCFYSQWIASNFREFTIKCQFAARLTQMFHASSACLCTLCMSKSLFVICAL